MPIRPEMRDRYPKDWKLRSRFIRFYRAKNHLCRRKMMEIEDIDEDFEFAGYCIVCEEILDMSEAGFCSSCGASFCWDTHGGWSGAVHKCQLCIEADKDE